MLRWISWLWKEFPVGLSIFNWINLYSIPKWNEIDGDYDFAAFIFVKTLKRIVLSCKISDQRKPFRWNKKQHGRLKKNWAKIFTVFKIKEQNWEYLSLAAFALSLPDTLAFVDLLFSQFHSKYLKQKESNSEMEVWWLSDSYFLVGTLFLSGIFLNFLFVFDILKLHHNVSKYCFFPLWHSIALFTWSFSPSFNSGKLVFIHLSNISSALFLCFFPLRTFIF